MRTDRLSSFDENLRRALKSHSEAPPPDFTDRVVNQIRESEEKRILARVVLQERLALAGAIMLAVVTIVAAFSVPAIAGRLMQQAETFAHTTSRALETLSSQWRLCTAFMAAFVLVVYCLVDSLLTDNC
ncbi:MAG TPA: hypothetical protein VMX13_16145 [Sedimentisphaerales bacterium]|nr:hypothetical protein [Sedimentisphaerales bacterium]